MTIWNALVDGLGSILFFFHDLFVPVLGGLSWGFAVMALTVVVRVILLPLAVKQINSMRAMQSLQPEIKKIQKKYKTDRSQMRKNPEKFKEQRQKQQEELMKLYKQHNVNPAAGCLPLLLQMPIFFALFRLLINPERVPELAEAPFILIESLTVTPLAGGMGSFGAWVLVALMGGTMYYSQRQMMANNPATADQPQMKIMLYVMPVMLTVFSVNFPVGVLLYWVTTNVWTIGQQWVMFRNITPPEVKPAKA